MCRLVQNHSTIPVSVRSVVGILAGLWIHVQTKMDQMFQNIRFIISLILITSLLLLRLGDAQNAFVYPGISLHENYPFVDKYISIEECIALFEEGHRCYWVAQEGLRFCRCYTIF